MEWQGTGPDPNNRVQDFQCSLDGGTSSPCTLVILVYNNLFFACLCSELSKDNLCSS